MRAGAAWRNIMISQKGAKLQVTLRKSLIGQKPKTRETVRSLGLRK